MTQHAEPGNGRQSDDTGIRRVLVTPELAEQWLAENKKNRALRRAYIQQLAAAIRRGEWRFNGDAVRFDRNDDLLDGQHRLHAIIEAGQAVEMLVIRDLDTETRETIDRGLRRTLADTLTLRGVTSARSMAATLVWIHRFDTGRPTTTQSDGYPSPTQLLALVEQHPNIRDSLRIEQLIKQAPFRYPPSLAVALHYKMSAIDAEAADVFFDRLASGSELLSTDPILLLRNLLIRNSSQRLRQPSYALAAYTIKAWKAWRAGRSLQVLIWKGRVEPFPELEDKGKGKGKEDGSKDAA